MIFDNISIIIINNLQVAILITAFSFLYKHSCLLWKHDFLGLHEIIENFFVCFGRHSSNSGKNPLGGH